MLTIGMSGAYDLYRKCQKPSFAILPRLCNVSDLVCLWCSGKFGFRPQIRYLHAPQYITLLRT